MKREIYTRDTGIYEFVSGLNNCKYLIPSFQREFVWENRDIIRLWESIYNFYPIGSILCWKTDIKLNIHRRPGGVILEDFREDINPAYIYILDGQQRATSLLVSIKGGAVKSRREFDHRLFFDCKNRNFFFADEYKRRERDVDHLFLIPLHDLSQQNDITDQITDDPGFTEDAKENLRQLEYAIKNYKLPLTFIRGFDIPSVSKIFELINSEGKALKSLDIMIARTFQNYQYLVEEDFDK